MLWSNIIIKKKISVEHNGLSVCKAFFVYEHEYCNFQMTTFSLSVGCGDLFLCPVQRLTISVKSIFPVRLLSPLIDMTTEKICLVKACPGHAL